MSTDKVQTLFLQSFIKYLFEQGNDRPAGEKTDRCRVSGGITGLPQAQRSKPGMRLVHPFFIFQIQHPIQNLIKEPDLVTVP
jgi:hypothetical protein